MLLEKEILQRMDNCATKIINIVNSMRNQIRNLGGTTKVNFKISIFLKIYGLIVGSNPPAKSLTFIKAILLGPLDKETSIFPPIM